MSRGRLISVATVTAVVTAGLCVVSALAGCTTRPALSSAQAHTAPAPAVPLATAVSGQGATWAIVQTGGPSVGGRFWQLLLRSPGSGNWRLATPPGVADNGGLVVASAADGTLTAGFVPSQLLTFTPLAVTKDSGTQWTQGLLPADLVGQAGAIAALPDGRLIAITTAGADVSGPEATRWIPLVTLRVLAATPAGRACGLTKLTGAAAGPGGVPMLAGTCSRPGTVGIFVRTPTGWQATGPALSGSLSRQPVSVLRLVSTTAGTGALLAARSGSGAALIPAWLAGGAKAWTTYVPLSIKVSQVESVSFAAGGSWGVVLNGRHALVTKPAPTALRSGEEQVSNWNLPVPLPAPGATLVPGPGFGPGAVTALVPGLDTVAVWQLTRANRWHRTQVVGVPSAPAGQSS